MFHLTPQEKSVLAGFLAVCILGGGICLALSMDFRPLRWMSTTVDKSKHHPPDINTAAARELDRVPGIGPKTAQTIVEYRNQHGPFMSLEGLRRVKGVTKKSFQKILDYYRTHQDIGSTVSKDAP